MTDSRVLAKVHDRAMDQFRRIQDAQRDERKQCLEDRRFYSVAGAQWEGNLSEQFANLPKFEANKIHAAVIRIFNEYRNNRISVNFRDIGDGPDDIAETLDGLYRADEQESTAQEAYDNAFEEGVGGGFGAWRLRAVYEDDFDDENDRQRIVMEPIFDADSCVFFDLDAKRQDKADAKHCFVLTPTSREAYKDEWKDDPAEWPKEVRQDWFDWCAGDLVWVAEYYVVEEVEEKVYIVRDLSGDTRRLSEEQWDAEADMLAAIGTSVVSEKKVKRRKVHKYILSGSKILKDEGVIAGRNIPIVPFYGKRWVVDGVERCMGHVRLSKDVQRLKNMQLSRLGVIAALSPIEKPIFTPEQMAGHANTWAEDNVKQYPYLLINPVTGADGSATPVGPVGYTKPPAIPPAMGALLQITDTDMQELLGNPNSGEKMVSNIGEKTVELIQNRLDMQAFIYMDNMAKAVKRCGDIWFSMAQELYADEDREMETMTERGEPGSVRLMVEKIDKDSGLRYVENDIGKARTKVAVDVGPSFTTRRQSTVRSLTALMSVVTDPGDQSILSAMVVQNLEGEGLSDVQEYMRRKLIKQGVIKPTPEEAEELAKEAANARPDPQSELANALSEEAKAKAQKAQADTMLSVAKTQESKAKTVETLAKADGARLEQTVKVVDQITGRNEVQQ